MMIDEQYINVEAGCGVVYDSIPEKELNETKSKAKAYLGEPTILVVDNYDSFTYNLVDIVAQHTDVIVQYPDDDNVLNQIGGRCYYISWSRASIRRSTVNENHINLSTQTHFRYLFRGSGTDLLLRWRSH